MKKAIINFWPDKLRQKPTTADFSSAQAFLAFCETVALEHEQASDLDERAIQVSGDCYQYARLAPPNVEYGRLISDLFESVAEEKLIQPTIIYDFPLAVSPLSKVKPDEPDWVERFEFYIGGFEIGNAFSELNDPEDQLERFKQQMSAKDGGDDEAHQMDADYVRALAYGLPPTGGEGIGIDRPHHAADRLPLHPRT